MGGQKQITAAVITAVGVVVAAVLVHTRALLRGVRPIQEMKFSLGRE